jgi:hypothetical protein
MIPSHNRTCSSRAASSVRLTVDFANGSFDEKMCGFGSDHPVEAGKQFRADEGLEQTRVGRESQLSRKCNANCRKRRQKYGKRQQRKEKAGCRNLPQVADSVRLATPLARFGKVDRTASNQRVGSSSLSGRATFISVREERLALCQTCREACFFRRRRYISSGKLACQGVASCPCSNYFV